MNAVEPVLTGTELDRLSTLEATIGAGLRTFVEVGTALAEVRDARLYRVEWDSFEAYCQARWRLTRKRAYDLMAGAEVVASLSPIGDTPAPANEAQARELAKVEPEHRAEVWQRAVAETDGKPTAAAVERAAQRWSVTQSPGGLRDELARHRPQRPVLTRDQEAERDRETSDRAASRSLARCIWTLATNDLLVDAADNYVRIWRDDEDVYPEPTTAERMRIAARLLNDLADRWHC